MKNLRNWLLFIVVAFIWGLNWPIMKQGVELVDPINFVMQRFLFASIALTPSLLYLRKKVPKDKLTWTRLLMLGILNAASALSINVGLSYEKSGFSAVLTYTQPLFVFCLATYFLKERWTLKRIVGITVGFTGVAILYLDRYTVQTEVSYAILFLLLGAFLWAASIIYYKTKLTQVDPILVNLIQFSVSTFFLYVLAGSLEGFSTIFTAPYIFIILYVSVCASGIATTIWTFLLKEEEATVVSASSFIVPMVALFFGWLFLYETIEPMSFLGFALILTGVYLINKKTNESITYSNKLKQ